MKNTKNKEAIVHSSMVSFEDAIMKMNYFEFCKCLKDGVLPSFDSIDEQQKPEMLIQIPDIYGSFSEWAYNHRSFLQFMTIEAMKEIAPVDYYQSRVYRVHKITNEVTFKDIENKSPPVVRSRHITEEEVEEIKKQIESYAQWWGPFVVPPVVYLDSFHLDSYLITKIEEAKQKNTF